MVLRYDLRVNFNCPGGACAFRKLYKTYAEANNAAYFWRNCKDSTGTPKYKIKINRL